MTITLHHSGNTRSRRVLWTLEELGVPYEVRSVKFPPKLRAPDFLEVNPIGTLPAFRDGDVYLTESMAICEYLARRYGGEALIVRDDEADWPTYLEFLHYGEATLAAQISPIVLFTILKPEGERLPQVRADLAARFSERIEPLRRALSDGRSFIAAERLTLADISLGYSLMVGHLLGIDEAITGVVAEYEERLKARPAYQRAYAVS